MSRKQQLITESFPQQKRPTTRSSKRVEEKSKTHDQDAAPISSSSVSSSRSNADILREAELNILRKFDVKMDYGPCTGISRLERWDRADQNGLNPSDKIRQIILKHENDPEYSNNLWHDYPL